MTHPQVELRPENRSDRAPARIRNPFYGQPHRYTQGPIGEGREESLFRTPATWGARGLSAIWFWV